MESIENYSTSSDDVELYCKKHLALIFKECPDGIVYKDKNLNYISANEAFCDFFDIKSFKKLVGDSKSPFLSEENKKLIHDVNLEVLKERRAINYVINHTVDNNDKFLNITTNPIVYNKQLLGVITIVKDITHEECLKEKFVLKHYQLKSLLENIPMLIYMQDLKLNFIAGTKPSRNFVSEGFDEFNNIHLNLSKYIDENNNDNAYVINNNKVLEKVKEFVDCKGGLHWYKIYKVPINDFKEQVTGVITLAKNVDVEKQLQVQREAFVATLGHDLKNPTIAQIRGIELLLKGGFGNLTEEQSELLEMVLDSCRYMNGMLASLLATYRDSDGIIKLNLETFSFTDLITECVSEMVYVAKDKGIEIIIDDNFPEKKITADRVQIKRVIMNLLSNGIKYAYKETPLKLSIYTDITNVYFSFKNSSPYINEEKQKTIFAQYVTYATANNVSGIGLGLYASKKIIDAHNGSIFVESSKDDTNIFGFSLPLCHSNCKTEVCF